MVFTDEVFHIHGSPAHLLSVHVANQRLFAARIFLAHAASLRQTSFFARWKFRRFLHSFLGKGGVWPPPMKFCFHVLEFVNPVCSAGAIHAENSRIGVARYGHASVRHYKRS